MNVTDKPDFLRTLVGLAAIKPGKPLTPEGLDVYWLAMQEWPLDEFKAAAAHLATSVEFMPNPYHFAQLRKAAEPTPAESWQRVIALAGMYDTARDRELAKDPLPAKALQVIRAMGGWNYLSMGDVSSRPFRERRFIELWGELGDADEARTALPSMAGHRLSGPQKVYAMTYATTLNNGQ